MPVAYAVFAMALGICAGALFRRTVPAMAVTLGGFIAARVAVTLWLRPHYLSPVTVTRSLLAQIRLTGSFWLISQGARNPAGQLIAGPQDQVAVFGVPVSSLPQACARLARPPAGGLTSSCRAALTGFRSFVTYQPASRFWPFQGIETGVFVVLAGILLALPPRVIRRDPDHRSPGQYRSFARPMEIPGRKPILLHWG